MASKAMTANVNENVWWLSPALSVFSCGTHTKYKSLLCISQWMHALPTDLHRPAKRTSHIPSPR